MNVLKKISALSTVIFLAVIGLFDFAEAKNGNSDETKKVLIVYFSQTGHTKTIADNVQKSLEDSGYSVDIKRIEPTKEYPEYGDELRNLAKKEANDDNCRPEFKDINCKILSYDLILVGSPTWWYKAPKIVLSFLEKQDFANKKVCFFITHGGGPGSCLEDMKGASRNAIFGPHTTIYFTWPNDGTFDNKAFDNWIKKIKNETEN